MISSSTVKKNGEDHIKHVDDILKKLDRNGFCISRDKTSLGQRQIKWLGNQKSEEGVRPAEDKVQKILDMRRPRSIKELRSVIGMWTYFASFIPENSMIASPQFAAILTQIQNGKSVTVDAASRTINPSTRRRITRITEVLNWTCWSFTMTS